jgi:hypothetical protein
MEVILGAAIFPLFLSILVYIVFLVRFDIGQLLPCKKFFQAGADLADTIRFPQKENLMLLQTELEHEVPDCLRHFWDRMYFDAKAVYTGEYLPEIEGFFPQEDLLICKGGRNVLKSVWLCSCLLIVLCIGLPLVLSFVSVDFSWLAALQYGSVSACIAMLLFLLFLWIDNVLFRKAKAEYARFVFEWNRALPVADRQTAIVTEAVRQNQVAFEAGVSEIVKRFDGFANETVLPALQTSLQSISDMQQKGMQELAAFFSEQLTHTLDIRMMSLSETIAGIQIDLSYLKDSLSDQVKTFERLLKEQSSVLEEATQRLVLSKEAQISALQHTETLLEQTKQSSEKFVETTDEMSEILTAFSEGNKVFVSESKAILEQTNQTQLQIGDQLRISQMNTETAVNESIKMLKNITDNMKKAMANAGGEIARGIKEATGDNAEAIQKLAEQSQKLRDDFEDYFSRIEESTNTTYEDIDYHVQNVIAKISETAGTMLEKNSEANQSVLNEYQESTRNLLEEFREQANSISLYAKEINLDIDELSENLKDSVTLFNGSLQESVNATIQDFDSGLAELSLRIANVVGSILDSVESLPAAIKKK